MRRTILDSTLGTRRGSRSGRRFERRVDPKEELSSEMRLVEPHSLMSSRSIGNAPFGMRGMSSLMREVVKSSGYRNLACVFFLCVLTIGPAYGEGSQDAMRNIVGCRAISNAAERLHCYDNAAEQVKESLTPRPEDFGKPPTRGLEVPQIIAKIRDVSTTRRGRAILKLDNGQTWQQLEGDDADIAVFKIDDQSSVTISRGRFGSYNLTVQGYGRPIRVRRID